MSVSAMNVCKRRTTLKSHGFKFTYMTIGIGWTGERGCVGENYCLICFNLNLSGKQKQRCP